MQKMRQFREIIAVLLTWKLTMENNATNLVLVRTFLEMGDKPVAEYIIKYAKDDIMTTRLIQVSHIIAVKCLYKWDEMCNNESERKTVDLTEESICVCNSKFLQVIYESRCPTY